MIRQRGFSLVELAVVILIMGLILGGIAMPLSVQRENARLEDAERQLDDIEAALIGFALANGFLPCPATPASGGFAAAAGGACVRQHGFVPATTLGIEGGRNDDNLLLDPWASPLRYSVSNADVDADGNWDFTTSGEMRDVSMANLAPDLVVCTTATGATATACAAPVSTVSATAPLLVYSLGKDWATSSGADQQENVGANLGGGPSGQSYRVASDVVFVTRARSVQAGNEYDDLLSWPSALTLYQRLLAGGQLP